MSLPTPDQTLSVVVEFRTFPAMRKQLTRYQRRHKKQFSSESHFIRVALIKLFRELDQQRFPKVKK